MAFPINPTNGQQTTENGIVYTYNSTLGVWAVGTNAGAAISANTLAVSNSATVGTTLAVSGAANLSSTLSVAGNITGGNLTTLGTAAVGSMISTANVTGANINVTTKMAVGVNTYTKISHTGGEIILDNGTTDTPGVSFYYGNSTNFGIDVASSQLRFVKQLAETGGAVLSSMDVNGHFSPGANNTSDLGTSSLRWRNIYTNDLQLSNGIGDYTIVEGEQDLFLYNNKTNKTFKFALIEVDPNTVPPKANTD
jgi:hypothetical protein